MKCLKGVLFWLASCCQATNMTIQVEYNPSVAVIARSKETIVHPHGTAYPFLKEFVHLFYDDLRYQSTEIVDCVLQFPGEHLRRTNFSEAFAKALQEYDASLTTKQKKALQYWARRFQKEFNTLKAIEKLRALARFLGQKEIDSPVKVFLFPGIKNHEATSFWIDSNMIFLPYMPLQHHKVMVKEHWGIVVHELCHQGLRPAAKIWQTKAPQSIAVRYLEGALEACLGDYFSKGYSRPALQAKKSGTEKRLNDDTINRFSILLLPLVQRYLNAERSLDEAFVHEAVTIFEQNFRDIQDDYKALFFCFSKVLSDFPEEVIFKTIWKHFFAQEIDVWPIYFTASPKAFWPIYIVRNGHRIPDVTLPGQNDSLRVRKVDGRLQVIIQTNDRSKIDEALAYLKSQVSFKNEFLLNLTAKDTSLEGALDEKETRQPA